MTDTHNIPASMVEAAARVLWPIKAPRGVRFDQMHPTVRATVDAEARAVLAAALAECEVREEIQLSTFARRLVITTPPEPDREMDAALTRHAERWTPAEDVTAVDTPAQEETAT